MNKCIDCGKKFNPNNPRASSLRGPLCNSKFLDSWVIPEEVQKVVDKIQKSNFQVFLVGGSVRDKLLNKTIKDYDLNTNASVEELEKIFPNSEEIGKSFGIIKVPVKGDVIEIATFRKDGEYSDGRRPDFIERGDLSSDLNRRDFTINAIVFDVKNQKIIDLHGGQEDLFNKVIKTIGEPNHRFKEDYLRMLRGIRFAIILDFKIEDKTKKAILDNFYKLKDFPQERILQETKKIYEHENFLKNRHLLLDKVISKTLYPHLNENKIQQIENEILQLKKPNFHLISGMIFHSDEKSMIQEHKYSYEDCKKSIEFYNTFCEITKFQEKTSLDKNKLILKDKNYKNIKCLLKGEYLKDVNFYEQELKENPIDLSLLSNGKELIEYGFKPNKEFGLLLETINDAIYDRKILNSQEKHNYILSLLK